MAIWRMALAIAAMGALACAMPKASSGGDAGASGGGDSSADAGPPATGTDCIADSLTGVTLCATSSACPGFAVDRAVYPDCGFRIESKTIDLECVCSGALCPMGAASTCAQAKEILDNQREATVCDQFPAGACTIMPGGVTSSSTGSAPSTSCDQQCAMQCNGDPDCIVLCGC
jgi:hypothetical protein